MAANQAEFSHTRSYGETRYTAQVKRVPNETCYTTGETHCSAPPRETRYGTLFVVESKVMARARHLELRRPKKARIRPELSPTDSKSKAFSTRPRPRARPRPTQIIFFISARPTRSPPSIRQRSNRRRLYYVHQTIWYFMGRSCARHCKKLPRLAGRLKAERLSVPTDTLMRLRQSGRALIRSAAFLTK